MKYILFSFLFLILTAETFTATKTKLKTIDYKTDFYCGCEIKNFNIDYNKCSANVVSRINLEFEHVVPASVFGKTFPEYKIGNSNCKTGKGILYSGRSCLLKISNEYRNIHNDVHNLRPTIGYYNMIRSDKDYCELNMPLLKNCNFKNLKCVEPRDEIKGDISRIYFYMIQKYPNRIIISNELLELFNRWNIIDPVDSYECYIEKELEKFSNIPNQFVAKYCN